MKNRAFSWFAAGFLVLSLLAGASVAVFPQQPGEGDFVFDARWRKPGGAGDGYVVVETATSWDPEKTAVVICDMWNDHWCKGATRRVREMADTMNEIVSRARERGALIVHAPSGTMDHYEKTSQRERARNAPRAANLPEGIDGWCSLEEEKEGSLPIDDSDGGCDCDPQCSERRAWSRQIDAIEIAPGDAVSDRGSEIWSLMEAGGIENVAIMGVHTNMCVLGRPFGIRSMVKNGKSTVLVRDLTDSMYNSRKAPFVSHRRGTELVVGHIEKHWCPTVLAADLVGEPEPARVVFVVAENEYRTRETLPDLAKEVLEPLGLRTTFCHVDPENPWKIRGLEALEDADLLVLSVRRRALPRDQMDRLRRYLESGKPLVAIRTASHAFHTRGKAAERPGYVEWTEFDPEVLGGNYHGHHGSGVPVDVRVIEEVRAHPVLRGIPSGKFRVHSSLYRVTPLEPGTVPLVMGRAEDRKPDEPVAWTHTYRGGRVFYTSLGHPGDFEIPAVRRLLRNAVLWALEREVNEGDDVREGPPR